MFSASKTVFNPSVSKKFQASFSFPEHERSEKPMLVLPSASGNLGEDPTPRAQVSVPMYLPGDVIKGRISVSGTSAKPVMHQGIIVELVGETTIPNHPVSTFMETRHEFAPTGVIPPVTEAPIDVEFDFGPAAMPYESYHGASCRTQYYIRIIVSMGPKKVGMQQTEIGYVKPVEAITPQAKRINMQVNTTMPDDRTKVGLELSFRFNRDSLSLRDVVEGELVFHECQLPVTRITVDIRRRETAALGIDAVGGPSTTAVSTDTVLHTCEIADGAPTRGAVIPVRIPLGCCGRDPAGRPSGIAYLSPTQRGVNKRFDVRWYIVTIIEATTGKSAKTIELNLSRLEGQIETSMETEEF